MKKLFPICVAILALGTPALCLLIKQDATMDTLLEKEYGDASLMNDITWNSNYEINFHKFAVEMKQGIATSKPMEDDDEEDEYVASAMKEYYEEEKTVSETTTENAVCESVEEPVDRLSVRYTLRYSSSLPDISIDTNLSETSNEITQLRKTSTICNQKVNNVVYKEVYQREDNTWKGSYFQNYNGIITDISKNKSELMSDEMSQDVVKVSDDEYYFLPYGDAYTTGTPVIYHIQLLNQIDTLHREHTVSEVVSLPVGRVYERLVMVEEQLVVVSHDEANLYVQTYGVDGILRSETSFPYPKLESPVNMQLFYNDHYVMLHDETSIYFVDIIDESKKQVIAYADDSLRSLYYQNGRFYTASYGYREDSTRFRVLKDGVIAYQGSLTISKNREKAFQNFYLGTNEASIFS